MTTFCKLLKQQVRYDVDMVSSCCWLGKRAHYTKMEEYREWAVSVTDWTDDCRYCHQLESNNVVSPRITANRANDVSGLDMDEISNHPRVLDIQVDSDCNAACLMCSSTQSTTWQKHNLGGNRASQSKIIDIVNRDATEERLDFIIANTDFSKLNLIIFQGGEPLKSDRYLRVLQHVPDMSKIKLSYITNGSYKPSEQTLDMWKKAKHVSLNISIDAIGEHFNYLRWPLQWDKVLENIHYLLDLKLPNMHIAFSFTITPLNIYYYSDYVEWAKTEFPNHQLSRTAFAHPGPVQGIINMSCVPPTLYVELLKKYGRPEYLMRNMKSVIQLVKKFNVESYRRFIGYVESEDVKRGLNFREVFPEVAHHFKNDI